MIVDNGSSDRSVDLFRREAPVAQVIETGRNLGFAGGYNVGLKYCLAHGAEWILMVNNDTIAAPDLVCKLLAGFSADTGAVGPLIYYASSPHQIWSQGGSLDRILLELTGQHDRESAIPSAVTSRDFLSGCCLLLRRSALEQVGLLDEGFFLYYEDQDWCVRFHQADWKMNLAPEAHLWHKVSLSSDGKNSPNERYWMARSSIRYFRKHIRGWAWLAVIPWRLGSAIKTSLRLIGMRKWKSLQAFWRGLRDGLMGEAPSVHSR